MSKMCYPKGRMVVVRDCTVAICNQNNPASILLSTLLFWNDNPRSGDIYNEEEQTFTMRRTQEEIKQQACNQIDIKTIHDTAVPFLHLFSYLTVIEKMNGNLYILHIDRINMAYAAYEQGFLNLKNFLKGCLQLESAPIKIPHDQLESVLIGNKRQLYLQLESVLIAIGAGSNCKRGRKAKPKEPSDSKNENTENIRDSRELHTERKRDERNATPPVSPEAKDQTDQSIIPSSPESQLLEWINEKGIMKPESTETLHQQMKILATMVTTKEELHKHCELALSLLPKKNDGLLRLGNLTNEKTQAAWKQRQQQTKKEIGQSAKGVKDIEYVDPQLAPFTCREDAEMLMGNLLAESDVFITDIAEDQGCYVVWIALGIQDGELRWRGIACLKDWHDFPEDEMRQALAYGYWVSNQNLKQTA